MTDQTDPRRSRARLDPDARTRILAEVARLNAPAALPVAEPGPSGLADLRAAVLSAQELVAPEPVAADAAKPGPELGPMPGPMAPRAPDELTVAATVSAPVNAPAVAPMGGDPDHNWAGLQSIPVDAARLERNLIITAARTDPAHGAFDVLRTRMVQAMSERGWRRVGITSPTKGCGKSFTALNLAIALSRYTAHRSVLLDLDMRIPALARYLGVAEPGSMGDMLRGQVDPLDHLRRFADNPLRIGANVAIGLNDRRENYASELFQDGAMARVLNRIDSALAPDLMLFDLPPALAQDDVIALRPHYDCILMVVGGGVTTPRDLREAVRRIGEDKPVLGMILNKADGEGVNEYAY